MASSFLDNLRDVEGEVGQNTWREFLFNVDKVRLLDSVIDPAKATEILAAGTR